jgi:hypothetical protein
LLYFISQNSLVTMESCGARATSSHYILYFPRWVKFSSSSLRPPLAQGIAFEATKQRSLASPRYLIYTPLWEKVPGHAWAPRPGPAETRRHRSTFSAAHLFLSCSRRTLLSTTPLARLVLPFALLWRPAIRSFLLVALLVDPGASPCKGGRRYESALWEKLAGLCGLTRRTRCRMEEASGDSRGWRGAWWAGGRLEGENLFRRSG